MKKYHFIMLLSALAITICSIYYLSSTKHLSLIQKKETEENEEDGMEQAMALEFEKTQDPSIHRIPSERLAFSSKKVDEQMANLSPQFRTSALSWNERGPNNIGGRTRAILVDANDASGNTIFAGSVGGGIWKCTNFKTGSYSWAKVNDNMANLAITCIAQNPSTLNTMYAGTGEGFYNSDAIKGGGLFKSTDGGSTWAVLPNTVPGTSYDFDYIQDVVVTSAGYIYVATRGYYCNSGGILKSTDGGTTWSNVLGTGSGGLCSGYYDYTGADLEIAANGDLYCTTGLLGSAANTYSRIFKSAASIGANQGNSGQWTNITPTPPSGDAGFRRIEIACAPSNNQYVYAMCQNYNGNDLRRCYLSSNGGSSWTEVVPPTWCDQGSSNADMTRGQAWYDLIAAFDPTSTSNVFIGGVDIMKSTDGGSTFSQLTQWSSGCSSLPTVHADNHNITFIGGSASNFILANDGGIYYTSDGGSTFTAKNSGYNITQYYGVAMHPSTTNYFLAGAQDNGTHKITSAGIGSGTQVTGGDGAISHIAQTNPSIQLAAYTYQNVYISRNGGSSFGFGSFSSYGRFINPSDYDEAAGILYSSYATGYLGRVINVVSGTPASTYSLISALGSTQISAVKVDPNASNTVWVGGSSNGTPTIVKLTNANNTPTETNVSIAAATAGMYVSSIDVEKGNSNHVLATFSNYGVTSVYESVNGGGSWTAIEGTLPDMPVRWGIFLPAGSNEGVIALATELGVFTTTATSGGTTTWVSNNSGFPKVRTDMLKFRYSDNTLAAATHGRGIFSTTLSITPVTWNGSNNNSWTTATNWTPSRVPGITDEVVIPNVSTLPSISTSQSVNKLTINSSASITLTGSLQIAGNLINNGTISGAGTVTISGFSGQTIAGNGLISNLTLNNDATITSGAGNTLGITGTLTLSSGVLTTNDNLVLKSYSSGTGLIAAIASGSVSGNVTTELYIPGGRRAFRFIGHPFSNTLNMGSLIDDIYITGSGAGFDATTTNSPSSFWYNNSGAAWTAFTSTSDNSWTQFRGARILIRGDRTQTTTLTGANVTPNPVTLDMSGTINSGAVNISLPTANGYHFVSNPYPSPVDIGTVIGATANIGTTYWVWDANAMTRGQYVTKVYNSGAYNLAMNGAFIVQPTAATSLAFTEANKSTTATANLFRTTNNNNQLELEILYNDYYADNLFISANKNAKASKDASDGDKLINQDLNFFTLSNDNAKLGYDSRPIQEGTVIPIGLSTNITSTYKIKVVNNGFDASTILYLRDKFLNKYITLTTDAVYSFDVTADAATQGNNRFEITSIKPFPLNANNTIVFSISPNPSKGIVQLRYSQSGEYLTTMFITDALGKKVKESTLGNVQNGTEQIDLSKLSKGVYFVQLNNGVETKTEKLIIQ
jgi:hypothetical protein